ncbi:hypothetical protein EYZ11_008538 [Aspergillus tanneri]|uniref:NWD NACHT-NTPase N-terminal domain-containing protein n=1 Tax=Aspergillus tanneri TaxID=1220188 RepID=A0A4S3JAI7_9EURO|nr:hypothetical protein EYZ11_008538 [Aspergillus tanneri]
MPQHTSKWRNHFLKTFHTPKTSKNANLRPAQEGSSTSSHAIQTTQLENASIPQDLWQAAYDQLEEKEQAILSKIQVPNPPNKDDTNYSQTKVVIDKVIQMTKEQYEEYQRGGLKIRQSTGEDINIRKISQQIISAALSFKDIVSAVAAFDPTNHAASTWAVVLLGLTV